MTAPDELWVMPSVMRSDGWALFLDKPVMPGAVRYIRAPDSAARGAQHVCGLQGFGALGDVCDACAHDRAVYEAKHTIAPDSAPNGLADELERMIEEFGQREDDADNFDLSTWMWKHSKTVAAALRNQPEGAAPRGEPVAWIFQHDETGRTMILPANEADTWADLNPRWNRCSALYAATKAGEGET